MECYKVILMTYHILVLRKVVKEVYVRKTLEVTDLLDVQYSIAF